MTITGGECRSIISPKFGRCSKPPNVRGRGLLIRWLWITVKTDRLFHISQIPQLSHLPNYLPVILDRFVYYSSHTSLGNDKYNVIWRHLPPLTACKPDLGVSKQITIWAAHSSRLFTHKTPTTLLRHIYIQLSLQSLSLIYMGWFSLILLAPHPLQVYRTIDPRQIWAGPIESHNWLKTWNKEACKLLRLPLRFRMSVRWSWESWHFVQRLRRFMHAYALDPRSSVLPILLPTCLGLFATHVLF